MRHKSIKEHSQCSSADQMGHRIMIIIVYNHSFFIILFFRYVDRRRVTECDETTYHQLDMQVCIILFHFIYFAMNIVSIKAFESFND